MAKYKVNHTGTATEYTDINGNVVHLTHEQKLQHSIFGIEGITKTTLEFSEILGEFNAKCKREAHIVGMRIIRSFKKVGVPMLEMDIEKC